MQDNGIGIHLGQEERTFHVFERLTEGGSRAGTGIGLAIVRNARTPPSPLATAYSSAATNPPIGTLPTGSRHFGRPIRMLLPPANTAPSRTGPPAPFLRARWSAG
jgi:hypothetical protein